GRFAVGAGSIVGPGAGSRWIALRRYGERSGDVRGDDRSVGGSGGDRGILTGAAGVKDRSIRGAAGELERRRAVYVKLVLVQGLQNRRKAVKARVRPLQFYLRAADMSSVDLRVGSKARSPRGRSLSAAGPA